MIPALGDWVRPLLTVAFGSLAGGLTNRVAIWMLFHPHRPPSVLGHRLGWLQGAMPKNQARLARSIGRAVGGQLVTPADVAEELRDPALRDAFEARLRELLVELVEGVQPSPAELLPPAALAEVREVLASLAEEGRRAAAGALASDAFLERAARLLEEMATGLEEEALADQLTPERTAELRERADAWLGRLVASEALERTVRRELDRAARHVLRPGRTLEDLIPQGLVAAVEHAINDYLPVAMERLGRLLEDPAARERVEETVHQLLDRFMRDLRFHQRVVAKLIITEETVERVLRTLEAEGADQLAELLQEPEVQDAMARHVNEGVVEFLRRPTARVFGEPGDPQVESALDSVAVWALRAARDPEARRFLLEQAEEAVWRLGERSWAELVRLVPPERVGPWAARALRSEPGRRAWSSLSSTLIDGFLERPIGRLEAVLGEDTAVRLADALAPPAWGWIAEQVPAVADRVRVADRVEAKVRDYPLQELEALVRDVTHRELDLIVRLGYVLGAVIGAILVGVNALVP